MQRLLRDELLAAEIGLQQLDVELARERAARFTLMDRHETLREQGRQVYRALHALHAGGVRLSEEAYEALRGLRPLVQTAAEDGGPSAGSAA